MPKEIISTPNAPKAIGPYSQAVKSGNLIFVSGQISIDPSNGCTMHGGVESQTKMALDNLKAVLEAAGSSLEKVVKTTVFLKRMEDFKFMNGVYEKYFTGNFPARSTIQVAGLPKDVDVEIEAIATLD